MRGQSSHNGSLSEYINTHSPAKDSDYPEGPEQPKLVQPRHVRGCLAAVPGQCCVIRPPLDLESKVHQHTQKQQYIEPNDRRCALAARKRNFFVRLRLIIVGEKCTADMAEDSSNLTSDTTTTTRSKIFQPSCRRVPTIHLFCVCALSVLLAN